MEHDAFVSCSLIYNLLLPIKMLSLLILQYFCRIIFVYVQPLSTTLVEAPPPHTHKPQRCQEMGCHHSGHANCLLMSTISGSYWSLFREHESLDEEGGHTAFLYVIWARFTSTFDDSCSPWTIWLVITWHISIPQCCVFVLHGVSRQEMKFFYLLYLAF